MTGPCFSTVIFDCDSTLSAIEGVDEVAGPLKAESARLTEMAMQGEITLQEVYGRRLDLIRPSREAIARLGDRYIEAIVPDAREVVGKLLAAGVVVQIVSGGFAQPVEQVGAYLGVAPDRVAAVRLEFHADGTYRDFDRSSPMARSGGKREWIREHDALLPRRRLMVGDGITDLETRDVVDCFAAFAGVVRREGVVSAADLVIAGPGLAEVLRLALEGPGPG
jgi:phosphoserine phosphatase